MSARFDLIRFNFMRAVEIFQDLNHNDMDVTAPPSSEDYQKESALALKLDDYLNSLVEEGYFDDCELRDPTASSGSSSAGENNEAQEGQDDYDSQRSTPRSAGFDYPSDRRSADSASEGRNSRSVGRSDSRSRSRSVSGSDSNRGSASGGSRGSFSDRFKRYIRRIIPGGNRSRSK